MNKIFFSIVWLLSSFVAAFSQINNFEVKATVKNSENIPLAGMSLFVEGNNFKQTAVSNEHGSFSIKLPVGKFTIKANEAVSENFLAYLEIFDDKPNPSNFDLIVETNQTCCTPTSDGKQTEIVKYVFPPYPPAAKVVRASGEVIVAVKIGKDGNVISAKTEIGHPLLRTTSEVAAKQFIFTKDENISERHAKIIFAFRTIEKNIPNNFRKPNRLEIFSGISQVDF